jgi:putative ABC transport system substrate-binding protein
MRRREFLGAMGAAAAAWPIAAASQTAPPRIGVLFAGAEGSPESKASFAEISEGLRDVGLIEGRDYMLEWRFAAGAYGRFPALATELARGTARLLLVNTIAAARAAQGVSPPIPVVMMGINDPVGNGLIGSLARPGGHTTGLATLAQDLSPKMLEYQQMIVPEAKVLGAIYNPANPSNPRILENFTTRARAMGMTVHPVSLSLPEEINSAFASLAATKPEVIHLLQDAANVDLGDRISGFAKDQRIPLFSTFPPIVGFGCLLAYGPPRKKFLVRAGYYVKRILGGADPADLPVEQPTQIELWLNMRTAKTLGITIPTALLATADQVIE